MEGNLRVWSRENNLHLQKSILEMTADKQALRPRRTLLSSLLPKYAALVLAVLSAPGNVSFESWLESVLSQDSAPATTNSHERSCSSCLDASAPPGQCWLGKLQLPIPTPKPGKMQNNVSKIQRSTPQWSGMTSLVGNALTLSQDDRVYLGLLCSEFH